MSKLLLIAIFFLNFIALSSEEIWERLSYPKVNSNLLEFFEVEDETYAWLADGLFKFEDGEFTPIEDPFYKEIGIIYSMRVKNGVGALSSDSGIYYLKDGKWTKCKNIDNEKRLINITMIDDKLVGNHYYFTAILYSDNNGETWNHIPDGKDSLKAEISFTENDTAYCHLANRYIKIYSEGDSLASTTTRSKKVSMQDLIKDGDDLYAGDYYRGALKSTNGGLSWKSIHIEIRVDAIAKLGNTIYIGTDGRGIFTYKDGEFAFAKNEGIPITNILSFYIFNDYIYVNTWLGLFRSNNEMDHWENVSYQSDRVFGFDLQLDNDVLYLATYNNGIKSSTDNGKSWNIVGDEFDENSVSIYKVRAEDNLMLAYEYFGGYIHTSNDGGVTWTPKYFENRSHRFSEMNDLAINNGRMFIFMKSGSFYSDNQGTDWINIDSVNKGDSIYNIIKINEIGERLFVGTTDRGVFYSEDNGLNWSQFDFGNELLNQQKVQTFKKYNDDYYLGTLDSGLIRWNSVTGEVQRFSDSITASGRVENLYKIGSNILVKTISDMFLSNDNGESWKSINGTFSYYIYGIVLLDNEFFVPSSQGIFKTTFDKLGIVQTSVEKQSEQDEILVYPQPATSTINLVLNNNQSENLNINNIKIHNSNGQLINNIHIGIENLNDHNILKLNCSEAKSGVYFLSLENNVVKFIIN